jgi:hypothetical protein
MSTLKELEIERTSPRLLEVLRRQGLASLTKFQQNAIDEGIMRGTSQILVSYDFDEAYQIIEIALLNIVASNVRAKVVLLCPNHHQVEKRLHSMGPKCRRLGIETTEITRKKLMMGADISRVGRVLIGTYGSMDIAFRTNPGMFEGLQAIFIDRLDLIGEPEIGSRLESVLVAMMGKSTAHQFLSITPAVEDLDELSTWLDATIVEDPKADVKRIYSVKVFANMYDSLAELTEFVHYQRGQIIILCSDIDNCERIASELGGIGGGKQAILDLRLTPKHQDELREISSEILRDFGESEQTTRLALNISRGIAFIHEGVARVHRRTISSAWEEGIIPVMIMPTRFAIASGLRATVVFLIGVFTQDLGEDISNSSELRMLSEWQLSEVLTSAGRRGQDNEAYGIVVVDREIEKKRVIAKYFKMNADRSISPILGEVDSSMDNPDNLQDLALASLCGKERKPESLFRVMDRTYWAIGHRMSRMSDDDLLPADDTSVGDLVSLRSTKATIKRAEEIPDSSVKLVSISPTKIAGLIRSSSREIWHYVVLKSEEGVSCSCESWKYQGIRKHRLCKHLVKFSMYTTNNIETKPYALSVLRTALWGLEIIGELDKDDLLQLEGKTMRCTKLGFRVASLGIPVGDARTIIERISKDYKDVGSVLGSIVESNTRLPAEHLQTIFGKLSEKHIEALAVKTKVQPGVLENYLEESLYALKIALAFEDKAHDKKLLKEFKKIREDIQRLLMPVS